MSYGTWPIVSVFLWERTGSFYLGMRRYVSAGRGDTLAWGIDAQYCSGSHYFLTMWVIHVYPKKNIHSQISFPSPQGSILVGLRLDKGPLNAHWKSTQDFDEGMARTKLGNSALLLLRTPRFPGYWGIRIYLIFWILLIYFVSLILLLPFVNSWDHLRFYRCT